MLLKIIIKICKSIRKVHIYNNVLLLFRVKHDLFPSFVLWKLRVAKFEKNKVGQLNEIQGQLLKFGSSRFEVKLSLFTRQHPTTMLKTP